MTGLLVRFGLCGLLVPGCLLQAQITVSASTYLGGSRTDTVTAMTVDPSGLIYVAGWTDSPDLPVVNARQTKSGGGVDAFVDKLSADGRTVLYCTYLGGSGDDRAFAIAVDSAGNAYVTGWSTSPDFPTTTALQARNSGGKDAFFSKLSSTGALSYSTYIGGSGQDTGRAIRVDASGNIYLAGETDSSNFPLKSPIQPRLGGVTDAFVLKLAPSGTSLGDSTYLGGYLSDAATALALDASGAAYVAGGSESPDFPTVNGFQNAKRGDGLDGFVTKINPAGTAW
ncbi:MAG: SBBP repeat-containing protein, partial [Acidobacteria bacterium]|nr:SBBP repeat-containing protein [Acidobacteriota bacterium]